MRERERKEEWQKATERGREKLGEIERERERERELAGGDGETLKQTPFLINVLLGVAIFGVAPSQQRCQSSVWVNHGGPSGRGARSSGAIGRVQFTISSNRTRLAASPKKTLLGYRGTAQDFFFFFFFFF